LPFRIALERSEPESTHESGGLLPYRVGDDDSNPERAGGALGDLEGVPEERRTYSAVLILQVDAEMRDENRR